LNENEIEKKYNFINYLKKKIIKIIEIKSKKLKKKGEEIKIIIIINIS